MRLDKDLELKTDEYLKNMDELHCGDSGRECFARLSRDILPVLSKWLITEVDERKTKRSTIFRAVGKMYSGVIVGGLQLLKPAARERCVATLLKELTIILAEDLEIMCEEDEDGSK